MRQHEVHLEGLLGLSRSGVGSQNVHLLPGHAGAILMLKLWDAGMLDDVHGKLCAKVERGPYLIYGNSTNIGNYIHHSFMIVGAELCEFLLKA